MLNWLKDLSTRAYTRVSSFLTAEHGQTLVEYGLILALIAIVVIGVIMTLGNHLQGLFGTISNTVAQ